MYIFAFRRKNTIKTINKTPKAYNIIRKRSATDPQKIQKRSTKDPQKIHKRSVKDPNQKETNSTNKQYAIVLYNNYLKHKLA